MDLNFAVPRFVIFIPIMMAFLFAVDSLFLGLRCRSLAKQNPDKAGGYFAMTTAIILGPILMVALFAWSVQSLEFSLNPVPVTIVTSRLYIFLGTYIAAHTGLLIWILAFKGSFVVYRYGGVLPMPPKSARQVELFLIAISVMVLVTIYFLLQ